MKVFISVDMEGVACVTHGEQVKADSKSYELARKWMTAETNAAIEGAMAGGATGVVVADAHGSMRNLLPDELHEDAQLVLGSPRPLLQMEGIDDSFDCAFMIGYHARAGDGSGILAHTHVGKIVYEARLNGEPMTEAAFNAAVAGHYGVPLALVACDNRLAAEVSRTHPWTERVITKWAITTTAARNLSPTASQEAIRAAAEKALGRLGEMEVVHLEGPITFEVGFLKQIYAAMAADIPGVERIGSRDVRYTGADMVEISRIWRLMINVSLSSYPV